MAKKVRSAKTAKTDRARMETLGTQLDNFAADMRSLLSWSEVDWDEIWMLALDAECAAKEIATIASRQGKSL